MQLMAAKRKLDEVSKMTRVLSIREVEMILDETGPTLKTSIKRLSDAEILTRACKGVYVINSALTDNGHPNLLHKIAMVAKRGERTYVSLESALSSYGAISQIPMVLTLMTTGRSQKIVSPWGTIEMTHTAVPMHEFFDDLIFSDKNELPIANFPRALRDLRRVGRNLHLVDMEAVAEIKQDIEMESENEPRF